MADAAVSNTAGGNPVRVRIPASVPRPDGRHRDERPSRAGFGHRRAPATQGDTRHAVPLPDHRRRRPHLRGPSPPRPHRARVGPGAHVRRRDPPRPPAGPEGHGARRGSASASSRAAPGRAARAPAHRRRRPPPRAPPSASPRSPRRPPARSPATAPTGPTSSSDSGVVRKDIRLELRLVARPSPTGVPLTIRFAVMDLANACEPLAGAAVYAWHCDQAGPLLDVLAGRRGRELPARRPGGRRRRHRRRSRASSRPATRAAGRTSTSRSTRASTRRRRSGNKIATSQIALPADTCASVYATSGYEQSVSNLSQVSLNTDNVFGDDGGVHELGTISGSIEGGLTVELAVGVNG